MREWTRNGNGEGKAAGVANTGSARSPCSGCGRAPRRAPEPASLLPGHRREPGKQSRWCRRGRAGPFAPPGPRAPSGGPSAAPPRPPTPPRPWRHAGDTRDGVTASGGSREPLPTGGRGRRSPRGRGEGDEGGAGAGGVGPTRSPLMASRSSADPGPRRPPGLGRGGVGQDAGPLRGRTRPWRPPGRRTHHHRRRRHLGSTCRGGRQRKGRAVGCGAYRHGDSGPSGPGRTAERRAAGAGGAEAGPSQD